MFIRMGGWCEGLVLRVGVKGYVKERHVCFVVRGGVFIILNSLIRSFFREYFGGLFMVCRVV
jgi:hypothetical protein